MQKVIYGFMDYKPSKPPVEQPKPFYTSNTDVAMQRFTQMIERYRDCPDPVIVWDPEVSFETPLKSTMSDVFYQGANVVKSVHITWGSATRLSFTFRLYAVEDSQL